MADGERNADELARSDRQQVAALVLLRHRANEVEESLVAEVRQLSPLQAVRPDDARPAVVRTHEHEGDLGLERLAELGGDEGAEVGFGPRPIHDRDDLRAPRGLHEAAQQLVAAVSWWR